MIRIAALLLVLAGCQAPPPHIAPPLRADQIYFTPPMEPGLALELDRLDYNLDRSRYESSRSSYHRGWWY